MRWTPRFDFGIEGEVESLTLSLPVSVWTHGGRTVGRTRKTATGVPYPSLTQRYHLLGMTLRFRDTEWPALRRLLVWAQAGNSFLWFPGDLDSLEQLGPSVSVFLDSPRVRQTFRPQRDGRLPQYMSLNIVLRRGDGAPWAVEYFKQPPEFIATGGIETEADGYHIHTFLTSGTFEVEAGSRDDVEVLIVGGGGAGGGQTEGGTGGGGGGGGRVVHLTNFTVTDEVGAYAVVVGAGAVGQKNTGNPNGPNGSPSSFGGQTAPGGGTGGHGISGSGGSTVGSNGGSGGGGGATSWFTGQASGGLEQDGAPDPGMGMNGGVGSGSLSGSRRGGGGGGATEVGAAGGNLSGKGGDGYTTDISGVSTTYGGGGGGCAFNAIAGPGGAGGGGRGGSVPDGLPVAGTPNTGGGGGGAWENAAGASGGSGIVIIRYPIPE